MDSVPKIPLKKDDPPERIYHPVPKGTYQASIIGFDEPRSSKIRSGFFMLGIRLSLVDDPERNCMAFVTGYHNTIMMIYRAQKHWLGMEVSVKVRITEYNENFYNSFDIIWPEES